MIKKVKKSASKASKSSKSELLSAEILIIGTGGAGLSLAIELYEKDRKNILLVGDSDFRHAHTEVAEGGINAAFGNMDNEPDTPLVHEIDTFLEGQEIGNLKMIEKVTKNAPNAIRRLVKLGADFHKEPNGKISQRYFGAHTYRRTIFKGDTTGFEIMRVLSDQVEKYKIPHMDNLYISKILVEKGKVVGAVGIKNNKFVVINAPIIVLSTGGYSNLFTRSSQRNTEGYGEGISMAFDLGARIGDMEMIQFHPTGLLYPEEVAGELVTEAVRGEGGILYNVLGERFMKKYSPKKMELSTRDVVARSNYAEIQAGRGTPKGGVYLDITSRDKDFLLDKLPKMYKMLKKYNNIDISKEPMEVAPTTHYTMGGIYVDADTCETTVKNLYAIGECTMGVHGANRLGGNSLAEVVVFGELLGKYLYNKKAKAEDDIKKLAENYEESILNHKGSLSARDVIAQIRQIMWDFAGIVRTEKRLKEGHKKLLELKKEVSKKGFSKEKSLGEDIMYLQRATGMIELGLLIFEGARVRRESRGGHFREDFPEKKKSFLKNFFFENRKGKVVMTSKAVSSPSAEFRKAIKDFEKTQNYGHVE